MGPTYLAYRRAAERIRSGWAQRKWTDDDGNPCMVQAILDAAGISGTELPYGMQLELDSQLIRTRTYCSKRQERRKRKRTLRRGEPLQPMAIAWNDAKGRTKEEVAGVLDALADRLETAELARQLETASKAHGNVPWQEVSESLDGLWAEHESGERVLAPV